MMKTYRKNLVLLVCSILVGLLLAEAIARHLVSVEYLRERYYRCITAIHVNPEAGVFDSLLGYQLRPNVDMRFETPVFSTSIKTNSMGFRDDEASLTDPDFLLVGDSFTVAWGVEEEEGISSQFEKISKKKALNLGVPGYSTIQETMLIEQVIPTLNGKTPRVLLLVFQNDLEENSLPVYSPFPTVRKRGREIVVTEPVEECYRIAQRTQSPSLSLFIRGRSVLADLAGLCIDSGTPPIIPDALAPIDIPFEEYGFAVPGPESFEYAMRYLQMMLRENHLSLHAFYIPHMDELSGRKESRSREFGFVMRQLEISHYDFTHDLEAEDYYSIDGHWKPSGHSKAAKAMARFLESEGVLAE